MRRDGPDALGAAAQLTTPDGRTMMRRVRTSGSYVTANDPRLLFGLGNTAGDSEMEVTVRWTDGRRESFGPLEARRYHVLVQGEGRESEAAQ